MPAQKRPTETTTSPPSPQPLLKDEKADDSLHDIDNHSHEQTFNATGACLDAYPCIPMKALTLVVQKSTRMIRKTRTVMECLHRFCRECIDKSMRLGNNECPACRTHCASRRSLRDDPNYDALIAALYPDIDKYEEEELAFHEEEKIRNKQIQASISQTFRRQAEALGKKRTSARFTAAAFIRRQGNYRNLRGQRNHRLAEQQESDEEGGADGNGGSKDSSSADERSPHIKSKRYRRQRGAGTSQALGVNANGGSDDDDSDTNRDFVGTSVGLIGGTKILAWGRSGMRSNTRHGDHSWSNCKLSRNNRLSALAHHVQCSKANEELKISLTLVSLVVDKIPNLKRPYLCCSAQSSVRHLCQYVAMQTSMEASEVEILIIKDCHPVNNLSSLQKMSCHNELQLLNEHQTLGEIHENFTQQNLVLAYRQKDKSMEIDKDVSSNSPVPLEAAQL